MWQCFTSKLCHYKMILWAHIWPKLCDICNESTSWCWYSGVPLYLHCWCHEDKKSGNKTINWTLVTHNMKPRMFAKFTSVWGVHVAICLWDRAWVFFNLVRDSASIFWVVSTLETTWVPLCNYPVLKMCSFIACAYVVSS